MRGIAAVMVVIFHAHAYILPQKIEQNAQIFLGFNMGYAGVEIFFVISGFIMWHIHQMDIGLPHKVGRFIYKRATRIYPTYWIIMLSLAGLYFIFPNPEHDHLLSAKELFLSATLLPLPFSPILDVAWTLQYEVFFYTLFALLILNKNIGKFLLLGWGILCVGNLFINVQIFPFSFIFSAYNLLFLFGMGTAALIKHQKIRTPWICLICGVILYLFIGMTEAYQFIDWYKPLRTIGYGLGASLILMAEQIEFSTPLNVPKLFLLLGNASYSIYLVHTPFMSIAVALLEKLHLLHVVPSAVMLFSLIIGAIIASIIFYLLIERNIMNFFNRRNKGATH